MANAIRKIQILAGLGIGISFAVQLGQFWWVERNLQPLEEQSYYLLEDIVSMLDSRIWLLTGMLHLVSAAALMVLAIPQSGQESKLQAGLLLRVMTATVASAAFILLGMVHLVGVPQVSTLTGFCAEDGRSVLEAYGLFRVVLLGSGVFALGWFLLLDGGNRLAVGAESRTIPIIGLIAGALCLLFVFANDAAPVPITTLMMAAVAVWGAGQVLANSGRLARKSDLAR